MKLTEEDNKLLEQFPKYTEGGKFVGTREYWKFIFQEETNRDPELHKAFAQLHTDIVDMVIRFCKEHNLTEVDSFIVGADGLKYSREAGKWTCSTDSSMSMHLHDEKDKTPFLFRV